VETAQASPLGALLVRTRKRAELTQEELAERATVSVNTISNLEAGRGHLPRQATLDLLVDALATALALTPAEHADLRTAFREAFRASREPRPASGMAEPVPPGQVAAAPVLPTGTLTFLVCAPARVPDDRPDQARAMDAFLPQLAMLVQQAVPRHGGWPVDPPEGPDGAVCVFPRADAAVLAACSLQLALRERAGASEASAERAPVCLALHTGWAEPGTGDYAGPTRRRTARLARLGQAGQLLLTAATRQLIGRSLPAGARLQEVGRRRLSVVERPQTLYQLLPAGQAASFPPPRALPTPSTNLPLELTSFIGREREQTAVSALLGQAPLVTLVGAGGCGKTRLALAVAADLLEEYPDGVWLAELAALREPTLVPQAVATALGVREGPGCPLAQALADHLQAKHLLLVLDNCEQLVGACAELAALLLRRCAHLQILATSRERLGVGGERSYRVPSLALPASEEQPTLAGWRAYEGVRLFVERAQACRPDFELTEENVATVAQICRRLDGIPLAIELAAARADSLPVGMIAARLEQSLGVLTGGPRDAPPRHRTLRATLDWSWELLGEPERVLLRRLAVFAGGWVVEAAQAVCGGEELTGWPLLGLLSALVGKSLVGLQESGGAGRYGLLETVRQYAAERLAEAGEAGATRDRHLDWCVALAEEAAPRLMGPGQEAWLARLEAEHDNLRVALGWARERGDGERGLRLAAALCWFWYLRGYLSEGRAWLEEALTRAGDAPAALRAAALNGAGNLASDQGEYGQAEALYEASLALRRDLGDKRGIAASLSNLAGVAERRGDYARAVPLFEEALALAREIGDTSSLAKTLGNLGLALGHQGDLEREEALFEEALGLFRALGDTHSIAGALDNLGQVAFQRGEYERARALHEEALALFRALGAQRGIAGALTNLGAVAERQGDYERATALTAESLRLNEAIGAEEQVVETLYIILLVAAARGQTTRAARLAGAAEALREALDVPLRPNQRSVYAQAVQAVRGALGEEAFAAAWIEGQAHSLEQAIALALA